MDSAGHCIRVINDSKSCGDDYSVSESKKSNKGIFGWLKCMDYKNKFI